MLEEGRQGEISSFAGCFRGLQRFVDQVHGQLANLALAPDEHEPRQMRHSSDSSVVPGTPRQDAVSGAVGNAVSVVYHHVGDWQMAKHMLIQ